MQIILDKLTQQELHFILRLLNAAKSHFLDGNYSGFARNRENLISPEEAIAIDREGDVLRKLYEQDRVKSSMRPQDCFFAKKLEERKIGAVRTSWSHAPLPAVSAAFGARRSSRSFVHAPMIVGVPSH